jgi:sigma-E factor negative regulatory protein RseC
MIVTAENPIRASVGDFVTLTSDTASVMKAVVVVYLLPLVLFFAGYALGAAIGWQPGLMGGFGFGLGVAFAVWFDRYTAKNNETVYTITGYAPGQGHA